MSYSAVLMIIAWLFLDLDSVAVTVGFRGRPPSLPFRRAASCFRVERLLLPRRPSMWPDFPALPPSTSNLSASDLASDVVEGRFQIAMTALIENFKAKSANSL